MSATQQSPPNTDQANESNPGGYNIICKHTAEMHPVAYLGQSNLKQRSKTLKATKKSAHYYGETHAGESLKHVWHMLTTAQEVCFQNNTADTECGEWQESKEPTDSIH